MILKPVFAKPLTQHKSLLETYRDHVSRNWPIWWSLRLGMPLSYILTIVVLASIVGLMADVSYLKGIDHDTQKVLIEKCKAVICAEYSYRSDLPSALQPIYLKILEVGRFTSILMVIPLVVGTLFSFFWFFYVARSFKFTNAPLLGRQPGILLLVLTGSVMLWAGLIGSKLLQLRSNSISIFDFSKFGNMLPDDRGDSAGEELIQILGGETNALWSVAICLTIIALGAVFLVLYRQIGVKAAFSGLVFMVLVVGLGYMILFSFKLENNDQIGAALFAVPLAIVVLICLYNLFSGHRLRGISLIGFSTLMYLLSFGPMWAWLALGSWYTRSAWMFFQMNPIVFYFICFGLSVGLSESLMIVEYRSRLRPA